MIIWRKLTCFPAYIQEADPASPVPTAPVSVDVKELAKEKLEINFLLENVFLITVDMGKLAVKTIKWVFDDN